MNTIHTCTSVASFPPSVEESLLVLSDWDVETPEMKRGRELEEKAMIVYEKLVAAGETAALSHIAADDYSDDVPVIVDEFVSSVDDSNGGKPTPVTGTAAAAASKPSPPTQNPASAAAVQSGTS